MIVKLYNILFEDNNDSIELKLDYKKILDRPKKTVYYSFKENDFDMTPLRYYTTELKRALSKYDRCGLVDLIIKVYDRKGLIAQEAVVDEPASERAPRAYTQSQGPESKEEPYHDGGEDMEGRHKILYMHMVEKKQMRGNWRARGGGKGSSPSSRKSTY